MFSLYFVGGFFVCYYLSRIFLFLNRTHSFGDALSSHLRFAGLWDGM